MKYFHKQTKSHELKVVKNIDEYLKAIKEAKLKKRIWFRGTSKANRRLTPSLFREKKIIGSEFSGGNSKNGKLYRKSEAIMKSDYGVLDKFKEKYIKLYPEKSKKYNLIDYLYIMQHYDIPTRLLDFSTDALIGLYFSVAKDIKSDESLNEQIDDFYENDGFTDKGSSIHCINPFFTNKMCYNQSEIVNIDNVSDISTLIKLSMPLCVKTNNEDLRIKAQSGVFMLYGREYLSYDSREIFIPQITKIFVPNQLRRKIKNELMQRFNIHHSTVYPDLKGVALEIIEQIESKYSQDCIEVFGEKN